MDENLQNLQIKVLLTAATSTKPIEVLEKSIAQAEGVVQDYQIYIKNLKRIRADYLLDINIGKQNISKGV